MDRIYYGFIIFGLFVMIKIWFIDEVKDLDELKKFVSENMILICSFLNVDEVLVKVEMLF